MSTMFNTMVASEPGSALALRLGRRVGPSEGSSVPAYRSLAEEIRKEPAFELALRRARAMSSEARLLTLNLLHRRTELCASEVQAALGVTHATVSEHMRLLRDAGLVSSSRRKKWVYYRLTEAGSALTSRGPDRTGDDTLRADEAPPSAGGPERA